jgi:hypothetical protein
VFRTALVGVGAKPDQEPVLVVETEQGCFPRRNSDREQLTRELLELGAANTKTSGIRRLLFHPSLPVDTRHNVKIARLQLAAWVEKQLSGRRRQRDRSSGAPKDERMREIVR